jgi:hypothetical protein
MNLTLPLANPNPHLKEAYAHADGMITKLLWESLGDENTGWEHPEALTICGISLYAGCTWCETLCSVMSVRVTVRVRVRVIWRVSMCKGLMQSESYLSILLKSRASKYFLSFETSLRLVVLDCSMSPRTPMSSRFAPTEGSKTP